MPNSAYGLLEFTDTLLYTDERGLTPKAQIEYDKHRNLSRLRELSRELSLKYNYLLTEKPVTIINKVYYKELKKILLRTQEMWDDVGYWSDNVLYRSASYSTKQGLLSKNVANDGPDKLAKHLKAAIAEAGNPEQILIHPLPSAEIFAKGFYAVRCYMLNGVCHFDIGFGGIDMTWALEQAQIIVKGSILNEPRLEVIQGNLDVVHTRIIERIAVGLQQFCLLAPGVVVPLRDQGTRPLIYEYKVFHLEETDKIIIEFIDFEIYK